MNIKSIKVLALIPTLLIGTSVLANSNTLTFSGECTAEIFQGKSETQTFSVQDNERVLMRFKTVGLHTTVYADLTPAGKAILGYEYFVWQASNDTKGESS